MLKSNQINILTSLTIFGMIIATAFSMIIIKNQVKMLALK